MAQAKTWHGLAAASSVLVAAAIGLVYWRFVEIPLIGFVPAARYRAFLLVFPAMATYGLLLWGVASFRLKAGLWRYGLAVLSGVGAAAVVGLVVWVVARGDVGRPWAVPLALLPAVVLGVVAWALWTKRTSFRWGRVIVCLVAVLFALAPAAAFVAGAYSLEAGLEHLGLAALPFAFVVLGYAIGSGAARLSIVNLLFFVAAGGLHLVLAVRGAAGLGKAFGTTSGRDVWIAAAIAAASLLLAAVNWKAFRARRRI